MMQQEQQQQQQDKNQHYHQTTNNHHHNNHHHHHHNNSNKNNNYNNDNNNDNIISNNNHNNNNDSTTTNIELQDLNNNNMSFTNRSSPNHHIHNHNHLSSSMIRRCCYGCYYYIRILLLRWIEIRSISDVWIDHYHNTEDSKNNGTSSMIIQLYELILIHNNKYLGIGILLLYTLLTLCIWIPIYISSYIITEVGIYINTVIIIIIIGRYIIRLIAFPGAIQKLKMIYDIDKEYTKYSIHTIHESMNPMIRYTSYIINHYQYQLQQQYQQLNINKQHHNMIITISDSDILYEIQYNWSRCIHIRHHILSVYYQVLCYIIIQHDDQQNHNNNNIKKDNNAEGTMNDNDDDDEDSVDDNDDNDDDIHNDTNPINNQSKKKKNQDDIMNQHKIWTSLLSDVNNDSTNNVNHSLSSLLNRFGNNKLRGDMITPIMNHDDNNTSKKYHDQRELLYRLYMILKDMDDIEHMLNSLSNQSNITKNSNTSKAKSSSSIHISIECYKTIQRLHQLSNEMKDFIMSLKPIDDDDKKKTKRTSATRNSDDEENNDTNASTSNNKNWFTNIQSGISSILSFFDPIPYNTIFNLDMIRGCLLCRYIGSRQIWIPRNNQMNNNNNNHDNNNKHGMLDVLHFPSYTSSSTKLQQPLSSSLDDNKNDSSNSNNSNKHPMYQNKKAVLYCNPNAGYMELMTGFHFLGDGNVPSSSSDNNNNNIIKPKPSNPQHMNWIDYYLEQGYDVYIYNYAGYGRSYCGPNRNDDHSEQQKGSQQQKHRRTLSMFSFYRSWCKHYRTRRNRRSNINNISRNQNNNNNRNNDSIISRLSRIIYQHFISFQPSPDTLRSDGISVAQYMIHTMGINQLIIHGESIGGLAAAGTARYISTSPSCMAIPHHTTSKSGSSSTINQSNSNTNDDQSSHDDCSKNNKNVQLLLICDRTFGNLQALAQRLVGRWSGYAISSIAPFWNTDIVHDYLTAKCHKIIASDASDMIIHDGASLKSSIATYMELYYHKYRQHSSSTTILSLWIQRCLSTTCWSSNDSVIMASKKITKAIGWMNDIPLHYRMAEYQNCSLQNMMTSSSSCSNIVPVPPPVQVPPIWPNDKHITIEEAYHFAACCKRIGQLAKLSSISIRESNHNNKTTKVTNKDVEMLRINRNNDSDSYAVEIDEDNSESSNDVDWNQIMNDMERPLILQLWILLGCCDGFTGMTLGMVTKQSGYDMIVCWLCSCLIYGRQVVISKARHRSSKNESSNTDQSNQVTSNNDNNITMKDFDSRPIGYEQREQDSNRLYPKPIPEVLEQIMILLEMQDPSIVSLSYELHYVCNMLRYIQERVSAPNSTNKQTQDAIICDSADKMTLINDDETNITSMMTGSFINLHCGHNNAFLQDERIRLQSSIDSVFK